MLSGHYDHWKVLAEIEIPENCDYVDFTGLDINRDWFYMLFCALKNPAADSSEYYLFAETDYTITHYYNQRITGQFGNLTTAQYNLPSAGYAYKGQTALFNITITRDPAGYFRYFSTISRDPATSQVVAIRAGSKTAPVSNITSLRVSASVSGAIGAGSRFILARPRG